MVKYWIATVLEVPRDFKGIGPSLLDKYVETYFKVTGDIPLDKELFKKTLFENLRLLSSEFNQQLLTHRNLHYHQSNGILVLSVIPLSSDLTPFQQEIAKTFCEEFIKIPNIFGSGVVFE